LIFARMKCKSFKIRLQDESGNFDEIKFNDFLENVSVSQIFASVVSSEFWSIVVFYEEGISSARSFPKVRSSIEKSELAEIAQPIKFPTANAPKIESVKTDPIVLNAEQEKIYGALRNWRNEQANENGLAPYMIAHNDSLMQIATLQIKSKEDLLQIKGFGEKRAEKYGDEILRVLGSVEF
jgi:superfamily II DNA helicase RecQ